MFGIFSKKKTSKTGARERQKFNNNQITTKKSMLNSSSERFSRSKFRLERERTFTELLDMDFIKLRKLRDLSWSGIPTKHRARVWKLLLGYYPNNQKILDKVRESKREDYADSVAEVYNTNLIRSDFENSTIEQILLDLPRTRGDVPFFRAEKIQKMMERILSVWSIRHPASGYVQGMNELILPFITVFLLDEYAEDLPDTLDEEVIQKTFQDAYENLDTERVAGILDRVEVDTYWCFSNLMSGIQDNYTFATPGIQRMVQKLENVLKKVEPDVYNRISGTGISFLSFAFQWMSCFLTREIAPHLLIRLWDSYFALGEEESFQIFHIYLSAAFLAFFKDSILVDDDQAVMSFLFNIPSDTLNVKDIELILAQGYLWYQQYHGAEKHLD